VTPREIAGKLVEYWNAHDLDSWRSLVTDDFQFAGEVIGKDGWRQILADWSSAFPDGRFDMTGMVTDEHSAACEITFTGTQKQDLNVGPAGEPSMITARGKQVVIRFSAFFTVNSDGLITSNAAYGVTGGLIDNGLIDSLPLPKGAAGQPEYQGLSQRAVAAR
jgi:steroid delta-isomerase-like uncharacterized protein